MLSLITKTFKTCLAILVAVVALAVLALILFLVAESVSNPKPLY